MRTSRWITAAVLFVGVLALVQAQPGRFGGGGFGGGPVTLLNNKAVQEDLKMTDDQVSKVTDWVKEERTKIQEMTKERFADLKDVPAEERGAKMAAMTAEMNKTAYGDLEKAGMLKPEQIKRLHQIDRQNSGVRAFTNPDVVAALKLTDDQQSKIKTIVDEYQKDAQEMRTEMGIGGGKGKGGKGGKGGGFGKIDPEKMAEFNKKNDKLQASAMEKITEALTGDQKTAWKDLVGEPFDVAKLRVFPMTKNSDD